MLQAVVRGGFNNSDGTASATQALVALAAVDVDAVWLALTSRMPQPRPAAPAPAGCRNLTEARLATWRLRSRTPAKLQRFRSQLPLCGPHDLASVVPATW